MKKVILLMLIIGLITSQGMVLADNPIVQTIYTADPAPMVYNDTFYVYSGHDEDGASGWFWMQEWRCYASTDMANWIDLGSPLSLNTFSWAASDAWAAQCIHRNGKFYFYVTIKPKTGGWAIGVGVADNPAGPFTDAIGEPLVSHPETGYIDPTVFIDDDGQAYMYWGNPGLWMVLLNEDMISYSGSIVEMPQNAETVGNQYAEGPWLYKRDSLYYLVYAGDGTPGVEDISYSMGPSPTGPWSFKSRIMAPNGSWTIHPGITDYKGNSYFVYHNIALDPNSGGFHRSVCIEQFNYNADGTIPLIEMTESGPAQIGNLNPFIRHQAEEICWEEGVETEASSTVGRYVTSIDNGDYIKVKGVDFDSTGAGTYTVNVACGTNPGVIDGGSIELHLDTLDGTLIGMVPVSYTGDQDIWRERTISISGDTGIHDLYLVFKGNAKSSLFNADYWEFKKKTAEHSLATINATVDNYKIDTVSDINTTNVKVMAIYTDGTSEDITDSAEFIPNQVGIVTVANGIVTGLSYGTVNIGVNYEGKKDTVYMLIKDITNELTVKKLTSSIGNTELFPDRELSYTITATFNDGHTEDVTNEATYNNSDTAIAVMSNGTLTAKSVGTTTITISYKGKLGEAVTKQIDISVIERTPYTKFEAEYWSEQSGVQTENTNDAGGGLDVGWIENGDWLKFDDLDFGDGAGTFKARVASAGSGGKIEVRLDRKTGKLIGTCTVAVTGGWQTWTTKSCTVEGVSGMHDLYLVFTGSSGYLFNINWWKFDPITIGIDNKNKTNKNLPYIKMENDQSWLIGTQNGDIITIYDITGKIIYNNTATNEQILLPVVKSGVYIIKIKTDNETVTLKKTFFNIY